jgi:hypothetical protein
MGSRCQGVRVLGCQAVRVSDTKGLGSYSFRVLEAPGRLNVPGCQGVLGLSQDLRVS